MNFTQRDILVCASKRRYFTAKQARAKNIVPYKCKICFCWHRSTKKKLHQQHPLKDQYRKLRMYI
jgi:hypothetical protein